MILIVEGDSKLVQRYTQCLGIIAEQRGVELPQILTAATVHAARGLLLTNPLATLSLVIMGAAVPPKEGAWQIMGVTTSSLIVSLRTRGYDGPLLAASADAALQQQMVGLGCTAGLNPDELEGLQEYFPETPATS